MAAINAKVYRNKKGAARVSIMLDKEQASLIAGFGGEEAGQNPTTALREALFQAIQADDEQNTEEGVE